MSNCNEIKGKQIFENLPVDSNHGKSDSNHEPHDLNHVHKLIHIKCHNSNRKILKKGVS